MKAMILAGGMSTRLYPLTKSLPKPLVPVAGEPNAVHVIRYLKAFGFDEIAINVHYHAEQIHARLGDGSAFGVRLEYLHEPVLLGSAGAVKQMEGYLDETFVVIGCDDLTDLRLDELLAFHRRRDALATIALARADDVEQYGVVVLEDDGRIVEFQEKPPRGTERSHLVNTGVYIFEPALMARIPAGRFYDFGREVFPDLQRERAPFYGLAMQDAYWCDIGTPEAYRRATRDVLAGAVRLFGEAHPVGISASANVAASASIEGPVRIGERCSIGEGARIVGPSVLGDDVVVAAGAVIERSILWDAVHVGRDAHLVDCIAGNDYDIRPTERLSESIVAL